MLQSERRAKSEKTETHILTLLRAQLFSRDTANLSLPQVHLLYRRTFWAVQWPVFFLVAMEPRRKWR
ncbi:hypothetical protein CCACVL1_25980 [Corchorus capsularis]|uniref:Uncharacterized protein n=1 Tax=Corchorus capsularis TaxID=210143 RepID=A0A1R3GGE6_COCAP|nr:hypothetical protein CCACVL1_25980 [Corchorus capsularis]